MRLWRGAALTEGMGDGGLLRASSRFRHYRVIEIAGPRGEEPGAGVGSTCTGHCRIASQLAATTR